MPTGSPSGDGMAPRSRWYPLGHAHAAAIVRVFHAGSETGERAYAAAQALRRRRLIKEPSANPLLRRLLDAASNQRLAVFIGAGVSLSAELPGWKALLRSLRSECRMATEDRLSWDQLESMDPLLCAQVLLEFAPGNTRAERETFIRDAAARALRAERFSLLHALLCLLPVRDFVTLNFDSLLERAAKASGRELSAIPARELSDWARAGDQRRLLKVHGSIPENAPGHPPPAGTSSEAGKIVLTTRDYIQFEQSSRAIAGAVQGLMLSHHLLFVGFGMTDPNFLRIHDSVASMLPLG